MQKASETFNLRFQSFLRYRFDPLQILEVHEKCRIAYGAMGFSNTLRFRKYVLLKEAGQPCFPLPLYQGRLLWFGFQNVTAIAENLLSEMRRVSANPSKPNPHSESAKGKACGNGGFASSENRLPSPFRKRDCLPSKGLTSVDRIGSRICSSACYRIEETMQIWKN